MGYFDLGLLVCAWQRVTDLLLFIVFMLRPKLELALSIHVFAIGISSHFNGDIDGENSVHVLGLIIVNLLLLCRSTRESTPCSFIRGCDTIGTPGSITRRTGSPATNQGVRNGVQRIMPTANEIEEFFATAENQQQRLFIEKYATFISKLFALKLSVLHFIYSTALEKLVVFSLLGLFCRYNFDIVNDLPLPGLYGWVQVVP